MGKKGKKGGKKGKKGKKGNKEPQMTDKECILAYKINVVEKKLEDVLYEIRGWEEKNRRHEDRNEKLKSEQNLLIENLLKQSRDAEKNYSESDFTNRNEVIVTMKKKWEHQRKLEKEVEEIKSDIAKKQEEIDDEIKEKEYWLNYSDKGQNEHKLQIVLLEEELRDMQNSFNEMAGHLNSSLEKAKNEITSYTESTLDKQKHIATERAIGQLDKNSRQEVLDNDWLGREVEIHKRECEDIKLRVEELENYNLGIMSELFECKIDDLKMSRNFFLTQFQDNENLDETGILEMDLAQLSIPKEDVTFDEHSSTASQSNAVLKRPQSATLQAMAETYFSVTGALNTQHENEEFSDDDDEEDLLDNSLDFDGEDFDDYLKLGPLELKLLNITGTKMPIHLQHQPSNEELAATDCNPKDWPVTHPMLKDVVSP